MPLYEYACRECGRHTEKIQKFSDPELTVCPHCGGALARTLTAPAVQFKGSGWYKDLYSSAKPAAAAAKGGEGSNNGASAGASAGSESTAAPAVSSDGTASTPGSAPGATPAKT